MNPSLWVTKTGLEALQKQMTVIANNLANANTVGFKVDRAVFEDLIYQVIRQPGADSSTETKIPTGLMRGTGTRIVATQKLHTQGSLNKTDNPLNVAIEGKGFFQVQIPGGGETAYSRDGSFQTNADGQIVTSNGYIVQPPITIGSDVVSITIGDDGVVTTTTSTSTTPTTAGTIQLADFVNPAGLQPIGGNLYIETAASGSPQTGNPGSNSLGGLIQGAVEASNASVVEELVLMLTTQRALEVNSKVLEAADESLRFVIQTT